MYLLDDLAERLRALPAGEAQTRSWLRLVDKLVPYSATAPALVAEAPDAVFEDASSWPRLLDAAFENRCLGVFFERTERGVARGSLARDTVTMAGERLREIEGWLPLGSGLRLAGARLREGVGLPPPKAAEPRPRSELAVAPRSAEEESLRHRGEQLTLLRTVSDRAGFGPPWALTSSWARALLPLTRGNATWMTPQSAHHRGHAGWLHGMEAFFEGAVAAADAARAAGFDGAASPDPFGLQKGKRPLTTPALDRFTKAASDLGEVLEGALRSAADAPDLLARADARVARLAGSLGDTDPMAVRRGVLDAMALGVAYGFATHRIRGGPFDPVFAALIERGGLAKPKKPSLAALTRAHPPLGFWPVTARPTRPASATQSCVARGPDEVPCPSVDDDARPTELGATTSFVCQVALHGLRGLPDGFAHGAALLAVFRGTRYHVVALGAADVAARERRPFRAAGLETLAVGRKGKEPVDPEWARRRSPELFPGPQSLSDVETVLGCYAAKTEDKRHAGSKIGGTYTPVQPKATGLVAGGAHLVFQLSFDDGAPLPDAGLLYVFALEGGGFAATDEHL